MESVIIPVSGLWRLYAATLWQRHKAKALVIVHRRRPLYRDFIKDSLNTFIKGFSVITYDYRGTGLSKSGRVRHNKTPCPTGSSRTSDASPRGRKPEPLAYLLAIGHNT